MNKNNETKLWNDYANNRNLENRNKLAVFYMPYLKNYSGKILKRFPPSSEIEDLMGWGMIGLMDAIEKFDLKKQKNFRQYAGSRIFGEIMCNSRVYDFVTRNTRAHLRQIEKFKWEFLINNARMPNDKEIMSGVNISEAVYKRIYHLVENTDFHSLNDKMGAEDRNEVIDTLFKEFELSPLDNYVKSELELQILSLVDSLPEKDRKVLYLKYYHGYNFAEISRMLGVSEGRIGQIKKRALERMEQKLKKIQIVQNDLVSH